PPERTSSFPRPSPLTLPGRGRELKRARSGSPVPPAFSSLAVIPISAASDASPLTAVGGWRREPGLPANRERPRSRFAGSRQGPADPLALDEVPVLRVDVERGGLRDHAAQAVVDLRQLVDAEGLPDFRQLRRQVVLPRVQQIGR